MISEPERRSRYMVSIIIPVLNEEKNMIKLQKNLENLEGDFEVIFCDGGSTDQTLQLIESKYQVVTNKKGRGYQMNAAAAKAKGDLLVFIHCDVELESDLLMKIPDNVKAGRAVGYMKLQFDSEHFLMKICAFMSDLRASVRKIIYGDQGFVIKKELLESLGGIPQIPLMEDLEFSICLRKNKIPLEKIKSTITTSARRFEENGMLSTMWQMQKMQIKYLLGAKAQSMQYEYKDIR